MHVTFAHRWPLSVGLGLAMALGSGAALAAPPTPGGGPSSQTARAAAGVEHLRARLAAVTFEARALRARNAMLDTRARELAAQLGAANQRLEASTKQLQSQLAAVKRTVDEDALRRAEAVARAARTQLDHREAAQLLQGVERGLESGDTDGVDTTLASAGRLVRGTDARHFVDAARIALVNEDLAQARELVQGALDGLRAG